MPVAMNGKREVRSYKNTATSPSIKPRTSVWERRGNVEPTMNANRMAGRTTHGPLICNGMRLKADRLRLPIGAKPSAKMARRIQISLTRGTASTFGSIRFLQASVYLFMLQQLILQELRPHPSVSDRLFGQKHQ